MLSLVVKALINTLVYVVISNRDKYTIKLLQLEYIL